MTVTFECCTENVAVVFPLWTATLAGTVRQGLELESATVAPVEVGDPVRVIVPVTLVLPLPFTLTADRVTLLREAGRTVSGAAMLK